jgi:hypothetical protein
MLRQRVVMTAQKAPRQMYVLLHRLHYALPGRDAAAEGRDAQGELHSARSPGSQQGHALTHGDFNADHGFALGGVGLARADLSVIAGGGGGGRRAAGSAAVRAPLLGEWE